MKIYKNPTLSEYFNRFEPLVRSTLSHIDALNEPPSRQ